MNIEIVEFRAGLAPAFESLNRAWIEQHFTVEAADEAAFADPVAHIIEPGGQILFAMSGDEALGTCALIPHAPGTLELAKMAVAERARGRGIGDVLMQGAIAWARSSGAERIMLLTNSSLAPALNLYRKHGFLQVPLEPGVEYARADVEMILDLR